MSDYFKLMGFPRTPWIEPGEVQARFLELSAAAHPDRVHNLGAAETATANHKFSELNEAAAVLREHKQRVQHLLALETGAAPTATHNIPGELIDLFARVGQTCRNVDEFLTERARAGSPMLQAQLFAKGLEWSDAVSELQQQVGVVKTKAEDELKQIATDWPARKPLEQLATLAHKFAMISRWESQLQERFARLASS